MTMAIGTPTSLLKQVDKRPTPVIHSNHFLNHLGQPASEIELEITSVYE